MLVLSTKTLIWIFDLYDWKYAFLGVGKSVIGNQLLGGRTVFAAGHLLKSKTDRISVDTGHFLGTGKCFTIIDTPGGRDTEGRLNISQW